MDKEHSTVDEDSLGPGRAALDSAADDVGAGRPLPGDPTTAAGLPPQDIENAVAGEQRETAETGAEAEEEEASAGGEIKPIPGACVEVHPADDAPLPPQYLDRDSSGGDPPKTKAAGGTKDGGGSTTPTRRSSDARVEVCSGDEAPLPPSYLDDGSVDVTAMETKKSAASQQQGPRGTSPPAIARADRRKERYARPIIPPRASAGSSLGSVPEQSTSQPQQALHAPYAEFYAVEARRVDDSSESDGLGAGGHDYSERSVIEAIFVPNPTWWQRHQRAMFILAGIVLTLVVGAVIAIGIILGRPPDSEDPTPTPPTIAPTSPTTTPSPPTIPPPPPIEGISHVKYLGSFFEKDCGDRCWPYVEVSGDTAVVAPLLVKPRNGIPLGNVTWERQIHILNKTIEGTFEAVQHIDVDYQPGMISIFDDVMAVGANWETLQSGAVYIYERNTTGLWNQVQRIVAPDGRDDAEFGFQVGIYQDVLAVGAYQDREGKVGSVYIYRKEDDGWALERKLAPIDDKILNFGMAVAIHGSRVAVGDRAYGGSGNEKYDGPIKKGAVWLYEYDWSSKNWTEVGDVMMSEYCENWWGVSLAFAHDFGLLVGCPRDDENAGSVYYLHPSDDGFAFRQRIVAMDRGPYLLGSTDQISVHGNSMVVGTDTKSENGTAHVFLRTNNVWVEAAMIEPPVEESLRFGSRVAMSGNNIVVSSWHNAHFYELVEGPAAMACISSKSHGALFDVDCELCDPCVALEGDTAVVSKNKESLQILSGEGFGGMALFGGFDHNFRGVAISGDVVVAGSPDANGKNGTVSVYHKTSTGLWFKWTQLSPDTFGRRENFGTAVDVDGDVIVVGAHSYLDDRGSAYIFRRDSRWSPWVQEAKLLPDDPNLKGFGQAVSVVDTTVAVGDRVYKNSTGAVFVYQYDAPSNSWVQLNETITNDECDGLFGSSVVLTPDNGLLIGCPGEQGGTGAVYIYTRAATSERYILQQKISALDGAPNDDFGGADQISVDRDLMVVGTDKETKGTVRVFAKTNGTWVEVSKIESPLESRRFGYKVALSGRRLLVSSIYNVYYYTLDKC